jgi:hypothetical protein
MISWAQRSSTCARNGSSTEKRGGMSRWIASRHAFDQGLERLGQVDVVVLAQLADDFAHIRQQQLGDRLRLAHVVLRGPGDEVAGDFEIQAQRSQMMADEVMQVARNRTRSAMRLDSVSSVRVARSSEFRRRNSSRESACCLATSEVT